MIELSQPPEPSVNTRRRRSLAWLIGLWGITAYGLWSIWPIQPCLTLSHGEAVEVIGLTPDGRSLVALTIFNEDDFQNRVNGPLHVWDLKTGHRRKIDLPGQNDTGERVQVADAVNPGLGTDPDVRRVHLAKEPSHDRSCHLIQMNPRGERWATQIDLDHGVITETKLPNLEIPFESTTSWMSPKCRWIVDVRYFEKEPNQQLRVLTIIDARTGMVKKEFEAIHNPEPWFSDDETLAGISFYGDEMSTTVWQLEPLKQLHAFPGHSSAFAFSPANKWFACVQDHKVRVIDIVTGQVVHEFQINGDQSYSLHGLRFSQDGTHLYGYDYMRGGLGGGAGCHCWISEAHDWNLVTGQYTTYRQPQNREYVDPNRCEDGCINRTATPLAIHDNDRLYDIRTGETLLTIPKQTSVELADLDHHIAILHQRLESKLDGIFQFLAKWKVPVPDVFWRNDNSSELLVCDIPSGRVRTTLPNIKIGYYDHNPKAFLLTPDGKTLVTTTLSASPLSVIHVWDVGSPKPVIVPFVWSLVVPVSFLVWCALRMFRLPRRWRRRTEIAA